MIRLMVLGMVLWAMLTPVLAEKKQAPVKAAPKKEMKKEMKKEGKIERTPSVEGTVVYIVSPKDGATVGKNFTVVFGLKGMGIAPAGVDNKGTGHHHLLIDQKALPPMDKPMMMDKGLIHFGGGQTQTDLELKPGKHTLQLLLGDKNHIPHKPPVLSKPITITVK